jgi:signal transduction histidine kinase
MRLVRILLRRWACLLAGGALLAPYPLMFLIWTALFHGPILGLSGSVAIAGVAVALAVLVSLLPMTRRMEIAIARTLLGDATGPLSTEGTQRRASVWYWLHLLLGGITTVLTGAAPFVLATCLAAPFADGVVSLPDWQSRAGLPGVLVAVGALLAVVPIAGLVAGCGAVLSRTAPVLLGPSPAEKVADLERRTRALAARNRMARELHDSIGHALTITTLQAGTAHVLFDQDPAFARQALAAIEETGRVAMAELDHMIGLMREGSPATVAPTLADLDQLLAANRTLGIGIDATVSGPIQAVPGTVSREMFRILQESLTNVVAHAGPTEITVRLAATADQVELDVVNPLVPRRRFARHGGGRGLPGMRERVQLLRGEMTAAAEGGHWRVRVRLPLHPAR